METVRFRVCQHFRFGDPTALPAQPIDNAGPIHLFRLRSLQGLRTNEVSPGAGRRAHAPAPISSWILLATRGTDSLSKLAWEGVLAILKRMSGCLASNIPLLLTADLICVDSKAMNSRRTLR